MNILITGGAGFIGSSIADTLVSQGNKVVILDNLSTGKESYIAPGAEFVMGDVRNPDIVDKVCKNQIDTIVHIAGQASTITSFTDPMYDIEVNFLGTVNIANACIKYGIPRLLFASSMTVYGHVSVLPVSEATAAVPISYYGITKYAAERFIHATGLRVDLAKKLQTTAFRMFNVYGPRQSLTNPYQGAMAIFIGNVLRGEPVTIYGDGEQERDFVFIDDVVRAWVSTIGNAKSYGKTYNIGSGVRISINTLVRTIISALGKNPATYPIVYRDQRPGDQRAMQADIRLAKKELGWKPVTDLEKGLSHTLKYIRKTEKKSFLISHQSHTTVQ